MVGRITKYTCVIVSIDEESSWIVEYICCYISKQRERYLYQKMKRYLYQQMKRVVFVSANEESGICINKGRELLNCMYLY